MSRLDVTWNCQPILIEPFNLLLKRCCDGHFKSFHWKLQRTWHTILKCRRLAKTCTGVNLNHSMKRSRERSTFWINQVEAISSMCREMDGSPCNIKSAVSGNASGATPFIAPAPSTTRPLALLSRWHFKAPTQTWKAWLPAWSQHNPPPPPSSNALATPAGPGQRQESTPLATREPLSKSASYP